MTQPTFAWKLAPVTAPLTLRVLAMLEASRGEFVDGRDLAKVGGYAGWSARIRELRRKHGYIIENRWRNQKLSDGRMIRVTEYRLL